MNLELFYIWKDARVWALWNCYAPQLSGASVLYFLILSLFRMLLWGGASLSGWWLDGRHPGSSLNSLRAHICGGCNVLAWRLQHPLFTDLAGNTFHSKWLWNRLSFAVRGSSGHTYAMNHRSFHYTLPYDQICKPWFKLQISTYPVLLVSDSCWNR